MKKLIAFVAAACCVFASCVKAELQESEQTEKLTPSPFKGTIEQMADPETKTVLQDGRKVVWSEGDEVAIFAGRTQSSRYRVSANSVGKDVASFDLVGSASTGGNEISHNVAVYPYSSSIVCNTAGSAGYSIRVSLPQTKYYREGSFANLTNIAIAVAPKGEMDNLVFKNIMGCLRLQIKGDISVKRIILEGNSDEKLAGDALAAIRVSDGSVSIHSINNAQTYIILKPLGTEGVQLDPETAKDFYVCVPPTNFTKGFTVTVEDMAGRTYTFRNSQECSIKRSVIMRMPMLTCNAPTDLSENGTANSYIVSKAGNYCFKTVKGNSTTSVGSVASVELLWESFGTSTTPAVGDLVKNVSLLGEYIAFEATDKKGNALIAAKDASGKILWSWHIWLTNKPADQVYYNGAGTMMDRNLGATSATPGYVGALGLLYQWGRKDPFLGGSAIGYSSSSNQAKAASTLTWPEAVTSDATIGTIAYAYEHPTTFIGSNSSPYDWHYGSIDNTLWQSTKTIYDPCPPGYRVPDGGGNGIWSKALGSSSYFTDQTLYNSTTRGYNLSDKFGDASTIWYPLSGSLSYSSGQLNYVGSFGYCWSITPNSKYAYFLLLNNNGGVNPSYSDRRAYGLSVRCCKERPSDVLQGQIDLSANGTANSYIVSQKAKYAIRTVKGNSEESVGEVASAEVLWESFGTSTTPAVGDLVKNVSLLGEYIAFEATDKKGNALIAAKDASGKILWSWHIWMTDYPLEQEYYNNAGTMMDRNLGATSATPGDVGALGLLYQWGRKDPFLGGSAIGYSSSSNQTKAASTLTWPEAVTSDATIGTIAYAQEHPTTFIKYNSSNYDWYYTGSSSTDNTRWRSTKTIYDPCPPGYRVPNGGGNGVWSKALGSSSDFTDKTLYNSTTRGFNFYGKFGDASTIWYPLSGFLRCSSGQLYLVGSSGFYWSITPNSNFAYYLYLINNGSVYPSSSDSRAYGRSVRCLQE